VGNARWAGAESPPGYYKGKPGDAEYQAMVTYHVDRFSTTLYPEITYG